MLNRYIWRFYLICLSVWCLTTHQLLWVISVRWYQIKHDLDGKVKFVIKEMNDDKKFWIMTMSCNTIVDRKDHVHYLTVSKSYSDECTCSKTEQYRIAINDLYNGAMLLYNWASAWDFQQVGMCDQQSLRSACAYAQSDQSLC